MFQRILVVLEEAQSRSCVFNTALRFAQANHAHLCLVDLLEENMRSLAETARDAGIRVEISELAEKTDRALINTAENWYADLIVMAHALHPVLIPLLPCTVLIVQQENNGTISMTMQLKSQAPDLAVRQRLERSLELIPSS
ncbi:universal stress protein [Leptolyngbya sp. AN03gr2]|uniref:universal stress protein n=1 Tax=unclassified Leptolyngbya TaxID=2650499 RepID=UPI003D31FAB1